MIRDELIAKIENILYANGVCAESECSVGELVDFILANFVPREDPEKNLEGE